MLKHDSFFIGFVPALIVPFFGGAIFYLVFFRYMAFDYFIKHIISTNQWVSVLSLGVILNLALFFFFFRKKLDISARGVLAATFVYAFLAIYFKAF